LRRPSNPPSPGAPPARVPPRPRRGPGAPAAGGPGAPRRGLPPLKLAACFSKEGARSAPAPRAPPPNARPRMRGRAPTHRARPPAPLSPAAMCRGGAQPPGRERGCAHAPHRAHAPRPPAPAPGARARPRAPAARGPGRPQHAAPGARSTRPLHARPPSAFAGAPAARSRRPPAAPCRAALRRRGARPKYATPATVPPRAVTVSPLPLCPPLPLGPIRPQVLPPARARSAPHLWRPRAAAQARPPLAPRSRTPRSLLQFHCSCPRAQSAPGPPAAPPRRAARWRTCEPLGAMALLGTPPGGARRASSSRSIGEDAGAAAWREQAGAAWASAAARRPTPARARCPSPLSALFATDPRPIEGRTHAGLRERRTNAAGASGRPRARQDVVRAIPGACLRRQPRGGARLRGHQPMLIAGAPPARGSGRFWPCGKR
jgi:hypothetical protein